MGVRQGRHLTVRCLGSALGKGQDALLLCLCFSARAGAEGGVQWPQLVILITCSLGNGRAAVRRGLAFILS